MADEILKQQLQQIADNDAQIGTNDLEIKGQVNALRQYGMGVTGIQRDRLGDVVYDLADGYGGGGGGGIATGSFTTGNSATGAYSIQHNLNSKRVIVAIFVAGEQFVPKAGYQALCFVQANWEAIIGHNYIMDATAYNATRFPTPFNIDIAENSTALGGQMRSPWTSQSTVVAANTNVNKGATVFDDNSITTRGDGTNVTLAPNTTYNWIAVAV